VRFLLDNNLSQGLAVGLREAGHDVLHVRDMDLGAADDETVLAFARDEDRVLMSADTDFGGILARSSGCNRPSVILFRRDGGRRPAEQLSLLLANLAQFADALDAGSLVVLTDRLIRVRDLPLIP
jgi:predicted nuclease of predicted toxin-antitoxin system